MLNYQRLPPHHPFWVPHLWKPLGFADDRAPDWRHDKKQFVSCDWPGTTATQRSWGWIYLPIEIPCWLGWASKASMLTPVVMWKPRYWSDKKRPMAATWQMALPYNCETPIIWWIRPLLQHIIPILNDLDCPQKALQIFRECAVYTNIRVYVCSSPHSYCNLWVTSSIWSFA